MTDTEALLRLQSWLSPAFPTGAFSYSHGLEAAVDDGLIGNADGLTLWLAGVLRFGTGRTDAWILVETGEAMDSRDDDRLADVAALAAALCGAAELSLESRAQGAAFLGTVRAVWPHDRLATAAEGLARAQVPVTLPVAVGMAATAHGLPMELVVPLYLNALAANMVSAGVRLVPLGQTDGQRVVAALEPVVAEVAARALRRTDAQPGSAALSVDLCAMRHETQYTRLFRS